MMNITPLTIELPIGYTDPQGVLHTTVTFGRRVLGRDLFALDDDEQGEIPTQRNDLLIRRAITRFEPFPMPVPLNILLGLDRLDRQEIIRSYNRFSQESAGGREAEAISTSQLKLAFGWTREGIVYDLVTFGKRLTGYDEKDADLLDLKGLRRACYFVGHEIVQISQSAGGPHKLEGAVEVKEFEELDGADITALMHASEVWGHSFRNRRTEIQTERAGEKRVPSDEGNKAVGS